MKKIKKTTLVLLMLFSFSFILFPRDTKANYTATFAPTTVGGQKFDKIIYNLRYEYNGTLYTRSSLTNAQVSGYVASNSFTGSVTIYNQDPYLTKTGSTVYGYISAAPFTGSRPLYNDYLHLFDQPYSRPVYGYAATSLGKYTCPTGGTLSGTTCATTNGSCGTSNGQYLSSAPTTNLCASGGGTPTAVTGTGPWAWSCLGSGGTTASCSAYKINSCGSSNGQYFYSAPTANLCASGITPSVVTGIGPWNWTCNGSPCSATKKYDCAKCSNTYSYAWAAFLSSDSACTTPIVSVTYSTNCICGLKSPDLRVAGLDVSSCTKVATPTFSPIAGSYAGTQSVTISTATLGATIYYTTDGVTDPTTSSTLYVGPITIPATSTIKAMAVKAGMTDSDIASATYTMKVATPAFSPITGSYVGTQSVTISTATLGAAIYYTTDGVTNPTTASTLYTGPITIPATKTIKAIAVKAAMVDSDVASATYSISSCPPDLNCTSHSVTWSGTCTGECGITNGVEIGTCNDGCSGTATTSKSCTTAQCNSLSPGRWKEVAP